MSTAGCPSPSSSSSDAAAAARPQTLSSRTPAAAHQGYRSSHGRQSPDGTVLAAAAACATTTTTTTHVARAAAAKHHRRIGDTSAPYSAGPAEQVGQKRWITSRRSYSRSCAMRAMSTLVLFLLVTSVVIHQCVWLQRVLRNQQQQQHQQGRRPVPNTEMMTPSQQAKKTSSTHVRSGADKEGAAPSASSLTTHDEIVRLATARTTAAADGKPTESTTTIAANNDNDNGNDVLWMKSPEFKVDPDAFSDSWWMPLSNFAPLNLTKIVAVEHACKRPLRLQADKVRMALDWFDLSVEHMSKWWKTLRAPDYEYANDQVVAYLEKYRDAALTDGIQLYEPYRHLMHSTMAIISFQPYRAKRNLENGRQLTVASLSATIASLIRVGMGRVVVVGYHRSAQDAEEHWQLVRESFDVLAERAGLNKELTKEEERIATETKSVRSVLGCELAYVTLTRDHVLTPAIAAFLRNGEVNLPRGALAGMQEALNGNDASWTHAWLGRPSVTDHPFRHLYLTEPDTLLLTRPTTVPHLKRLLDEGLVLAPHRLQPLPYQADVPESTFNDSFISIEEWTSRNKPLTTLDALQNDVCCDEQAAWYRPGSSVHLYDKCDDQWWRCGFSTRPGNHSRILNHYDLIRPIHGMGVVTLAGTGHGRRCIPARNSQCVRQMSVNHPDHPDNPWIESYRAKQAQK